MNMLLPDICKIQYGYAFDSAKFSDSEGIPLIRIRDVVRGYSETYTTEKCGEEYIVNDGDMLIGMDGEFNIAHWKGGKAYLNQRVCRLIPSDEVDALYLYYFMPKALKAIEDKTPFVTVKHLSAKELNKVVVPMPSMHEQKKIASSLQKVDELIALRKEQLAKLDQLVKSRFIELFGDPFLNPMKWKKVKIENVVTVEPQNGMYKPQSDYVVDGSGTPILRIDGFYNGTVTDFSTLKRLRCEDREKQKYLLKEDDIVINRVNSIEYLGKCAHITGLLEDTVYESNMMRMHFDSEYFNPVYVTHLLCSRFIYNQIVNHAKKAVNQASINQKDVLDFDIYQPPIEVQNRFATFVKQTDKSKLEIQQSLDKLELLKKALMQEYFE